jgi:cellulose synthase/poly-beta-1,6-N-acetylglucosamine synthase-like glycosyltransferase
MSSPEVTVILPVYNAAETIAQTITSVLDQTFRSFELIIIDDGSTDDSLQRLKTFAMQDERIHLVARENGGVSSARNLGVELGKAPYVAFIDADDIWAPEKLGCHVALHRDEPMVAASYARIGFLPQHAGTIAECRTVSTPRNDRLRLVDVLGENPVCTMSNLFLRRDWFVYSGGLDTALSHAEDQEFVAQLIARGARVESIDALLVGYRFSPDGLSMDLDRMKAGWHTVAHRYLDGPELASLEALYLRYLARRTLRSG